MDYKKMIKQLGGAERIRQTIKKGEENGAFLSANYKRLLREHPNQWVGVQDKQVVAVSPTIDGLIKKMRKAGIRMGTAKIKFLDPNPRPIILSAAIA